MNPLLKKPPSDISSLTTPQNLSHKLNVLIGTPFNLTGKSRTDGSNLRKLIGRTLLADSPPQAALEKSYRIIPPKGVPKILLEYIDTYIVTSGTSYNLQVWNRNPSCESVQIEYAGGEQLNTGDIRYILVKINPREHTIHSIAILTPEYIVEKFGMFGKQTIKHQLIISESSRQFVLSKKDRILYYPDDNRVGKNKNRDNISQFNIHENPTSKSLLPLSSIKNIVVNQFIGHTVLAAATKTRGQLLEKKFAVALGYNLGDNELLAGGYPDIKNQALEVKIQDSPTIDLGRYSPAFEEGVIGCDRFTTKNIRYFIALTNPSSGIIEGAILCPGNKLGSHFSYVPEKSFKCQRSIPMSFFEEIEGQSVFNP